MFKHKTFICEPLEFDEQLDKWIEEVKPKSHILRGLEVQHDGNYHYVIVNLNYDWTD